MVSVHGLDAGLNNIFDRNYSLVEGYPEEGRNFFVTLCFFNFN
jgi:iron complex outermembrane receptor protein